jgi:glucose-1-phosphate thymidylyltransferase
MRIIEDGRYKPVSQFVLENLTASNVRHLVFVINETKNQMMQYFGNGSRFNCDISYVMQESALHETRSTSPGLADALDSAYHLTRDKVVLCGMADTIVEPRNVFDHLLEAAKPGDQLILGLFAVDKPASFGMVSFDASMTVQRIHDKPLQTDLRLAWGCLAWHSGFTEHLHQCVKERGEGDFAAVMNTAIQQGMGVRAVVLPDGNYRDMGTYDALANLDQKYRR